MVVVAAFSRDLAVSLALAVVLDVALARSLALAAAVLRQAGLALVLTGQSQFDTKTCRKLDLDGALMSGCV